MRSGLWIGLVGVLIAVAFLGFLAIKLGDIPLIIVCGIAIVLMVTGLLRDEAGNGAPR